MILGNGTGESRAVLPHHRATSSLAHKEPQHAPHLRGHFTRGDGADMGGGGCGQGGGRAHLDAALARQLHSSVVVATAQQVLHHHAVHALPLPHAGGRGLVTAVLLQVLDPALAQLGALVLRLDGLHCLQHRRCAGARRPTTPTSSHTGACQLSIPAPQRGPPLGPQGKSLCSALPVPVLPDQRLPSRCSFLQGCRPPRSLKPEAPHLSLWAVHVLSTSTPER